MNMLMTPIMRCKYNLVIMQTEKTYENTYSRLPNTTHHLKYPWSTNRPAGNPIAITKNNCVLPIQLIWLALRDVLGWRV